MLDIRLIREKPDFVKAELAKVGLTGEPIDALLGLDQKRRELIREVEQLKAHHSSRSREIRGLANPQEKEKAVEEMRTLGDRVSQLDKDLAVLEEEFRSRMLEIPNLPHPQVPYGQDERENVVMRAQGVMREFSFAPKPHWELGPELGIIDFERGVKISGTRFYVLKGLGARLQRALISWMIDLHVQEHGYTEVYIPHF